MRAFESHNEYVGFIKFGEFLTRIETFNFSRRILLLRVGYKCQFSVNGFLTMWKNIVKEVTSLAGEVWEL